MKKRICLGIVLVLGITLLMGCSSGNDETTKVTSDRGETVANDVSDEKVTVKVLQFKTELSEQMVAMAEEYMKEHPNVNLQIESVISNDYDTVLKTRFASGQAPDIFNNQGHSNMQLWLENLEDLSDQPWVDDMLEFTKEAITSDGKIYGMPLYLESYGFLYNKDYFEQAGITEVPVTLTGLAEAIEKLEAAGFKVFSINGAEWYPNGVFLANVPMAQQEDSTAFINQINDGTATFIDNEIYNDWMDMVDLMKSHAASDPMSVDFSTVVSDFSNGQVAMILGTNGYQLMIDEVNPDLNIGMMPMPINDDAQFNDNIYVSASTYWCVNKNSASKEAAKEFLDWLVTSEIGQRYITEDFGFIPGLKSIEINEYAVGPLGMDTLMYIKAGKTAGWEWPKYLDGVTIEFGGAIQKFYAGELDKAGVLENFQASWEDLKDN